MNILKENLTNSTKIGKVIAALGAGGAALCCFWFLLIGRDVSRLGIRKALEVARGLLRKEDRSLHRGGCSNTDKTDAMRNELLD